MTDLHQPSDTTTTGSADADAVTHRFRGSSYEHALATATRELGDGVRVVEASRIRRGGLGGFFATDLGVEIAVVPDERADRAFSAEVMQLADGGMEGLLAEIERAERQSVRSVAESVAPAADSAPVSFADHLADAERPGDESSRNGNASEPEAIIGRRSVPNRSGRRPASPRPTAGAPESARPGPGSRFELGLADGEQQTEVVEAERRRALAAHLTPEIEQQETPTPDAAEMPDAADVGDVADTVEVAEAVAVAEAVEDVEPANPSDDAAIRTDDETETGTHDAEHSDESIDELDALLRRAGVAVPGDEADAAPAVEVMPKASAPHSAAVVATTSVDLVAQTTDRLLSRLAAVVPARGSCLDDLVMIRVSVTTPDGTKVEMTAESARRHD